MVGQADLRWNPGSAGGENFSESPYDADIDVYFRIATQQCNLLPVGE